MIFTCTRCFTDIKVRKLGQGSNGAFRYLTNDNKIIFGKVCNICRNKAQRENRIKNNNSVTKKYEKTQRGYLMRTYRNMKSRITGVQKLKSHLYEGLCLLSKESFYEWALSSKDFKKLFSIYKRNNFQIKLAPSINRKDSSLGYTIENMEWITQSKNSSLGSINRHLG